ncbi:MAG: hypothetical protein ACLTHL_00560 [Collinsella sp.]
MKQEAQKVKYSISIFVHIAGILSVLYFAFQLNMDSRARELFATALWAGNSTLDAEAQGIWAVISYLIFNGLPIVLPLLVVGICPLSHLWSTAQVLLFIIQWLITLICNVSVEPGVMCRYAGWFLYIPIGIGEFLPTSFVMNVVKLMIVLVFWGMVMSAAADPAGYFEGAFSPSSSSTRRFDGGDIQDDLDRIEQRSQHKQVMDELNSIHADALNGRFRE